MVAGDKVIKGAETAAEEQKVAVLLDGSSTGCEEVLARWHSGASE